MRPYGRGRAGSPKTSRSATRPLSTTPRRWTWRGLTAYVAASASGAFSHNLDFKANEDRLAEEVDMAAFGMAAEDADLSNMLSALSRALKKGALDAFKAEWLSADRIGGDEG